MQAFETMTDFSDEELLRMFHEPDGQKRHYVFNLLVKKYQQRVYQHARRMVIDHSDADDMVQNTFIKVWSNLDQFREESQLYTWIYRIATNECLALLRQRRRRFMLPIHDVEHDLAVKLAQQDTPINADKLEMRLHQAILKLPQKQRLVFNLRYFDEMKYEDMSKILGTTVGALKASYHHAVQKVEKYLTSL